MKTIRGRNKFGVDCQRYFEGSTLVGLLYFESHPFPGESGTPGKVMRVFDWPPFRNRAVNNEAEAAAFLEELRSSPEYVKIQAQRYPAFAEHNPDLVALR